MGKGSSGNVCYGFGVGMRIRGGNLEDHGKISHDQTEVDRVYACKSYRDITWILSVHEIEQP